MNISTLRPFVLFASGFLACFVLVSSGGAREEDKAKDLRAAIVKATKQGLETERQRFDTGTGNLEGLARWSRRHNDARVAAGELTPVEGATANFELALKTEQDARKLAKFGRLSAGDVNQAHYFRLQAELELELAKRGAKKK